MSFELVRSVIACDVESENQSNIFRPELMSGDSNLSSLLEVHELVVGQLLDSSSYSLEGTLQPRPEGLVIGLGPQSHSIFVLVLCCRYALHIQFLQNRLYWCKRLKVLFDWSSINIIIFTSSPWLVMVRTAAFQPHKVRFSDLHKIYLDQSLRGDCLSIGILEQCFVWQRNFILAAGPC